MKEIISQTKMYLADYTSMNSYSIRVEYISERKHRIIHNRHCSYSQVSTWRAKEIWHVRTGTSFRHLMLHKKKLEGTLLCRLMFHRILFQQINLSVSLCSFELSSVCWELYIVEHLFNWITIATIRLSALKWLGMSNMSSS